EIWMEGSVRRSVSQMLRDAQTTGVTEALARNGIRRIHKRGRWNTTVLWFCASVIHRQLLRNSEFAGHSIDQYLLRLPGAKRSKQRLGGSETFWGVEVPAE